MPLLRRVPHPADSICPTRYAYSSPRIADLLSWLACGIVLRVTPIIIRARTAHDDHQFVQGSYYVPNVPKDMRPYHYR